MEWEGVLELYLIALKCMGGVKFNLKSRIKGDPSASYLSYTSPGPILSYRTDGSLYAGELWVKKLDTINQIVSGTFWFNAVNSNNDTIKITEGRFDMRYTR